MIAEGLEASRAGHTILKRLLPQPAESSESLTAVRKIIRCDECSSERPAVCLVKLRFFCTEHFVAYCYQGLAEAESEHQNPQVLRELPARMRHRSCQDPADGARS
jgi:hypothetical protein